MKIMNPTYVHLVINHMAVIGTFLAVVVLLFAIKTDSRHTYFAAYTVLIIATASAFVAYFSGEGAEETVEQIAGVSESAIEQHEDSAKVTLIGFVILGCFTVVTIILTQRKQHLQRKLAAAVLAVSALAFSLAARTAWLGGKIRHTEITESRTAPQDDD
ncbi:MAG TPA: hypothetical protein PLS80_01585 [Cyclobacteriaceae bacterium]|jgi:uncharacterized membrane protein|nr:hypothetical protein [Cyclobacteriaceae bacterium]HNH58686.1 hypothetical protein [Cyclobacteriaceae bacterium]